MGPTRRPPHRTRDGVPSPSGGAVGWLRSRFAWLLLLAGIVLLFADLSDVYLWQDEAETGVIARHMLTYGLPLSTDGRDWVQQSPEVLREFNRDYIWIYHPWLQYLLAAASFAVLGITTFAARFPFALTGLATVLALYHFVSRWLHDSLTAPVAGVLLLLCVPFIVLVRQCRYYALSALFTLLVVDSYLWLRSDPGRPWAAPYFVLSAVLLFHSFYVAFFPTLAALVAHMLLSRRRRWLLARASPAQNAGWSTERAKGKDAFPEARRRVSPSVGPGSTGYGATGGNGAWLEMPDVRFLFALLLIALLTLPWTTLIPAWRGGLTVLSTTQQTVQRLATGGIAPTEPQQSAWESALGSLGQYFLFITLWILPLILGLVWLIAWLLSRRRPARPHSGPAQDAGRTTSAGRLPRARRGRGSRPERGWSTDRLPSRSTLVEGDERQPAGMVRPGGPVLRANRTAFCQVVGSVIVANIVALSVLDYAFFRYLTHLMPLLLALLAVAVAWFIERWPMAGYALLFLLVTSNGLHVFPYMSLKVAVPQQSDLWREVRASPATEWIDQIRTVSLRSDLWMYGQELTHPYQGPNEGLVAYLSVHATPGQTVLVNYEDLPLQFYTNLRVLGGFSAHGLAPPAQSAGWSTDDLRPDWVIDRKYGPYRDLLAGILAAGSYERITIPFPDIRWENREEARQHHYLTVQDADPVTLYRRQGG